MKIKTSELTGAALDWAVPMCEKPGTMGHPAHWEPSTNWAQGGPIIEREDIATWPDDEGGYFASANRGRAADYHGPTYLIAAMRCYVASRLGDEVEIPDELT